MPEELPQNRPLPTAWLTDVVGHSLDEDLGGFPGRDVTTQSTIPQSVTVSGQVAVRQAGVVCALAVIKETLVQVEDRYGLPASTVEVLVDDGAWVDAGTAVARIEGSGHAVLIAERTILNLLSRAAGIATHTRRWADALDGTPAKVLDTRKTTPTLRELEKYAVRMGGGVNKRFGLYDCAMVKDNHIVAQGSIAGAVEAIRKASPDVPIQVEVESLAQAQEALDSGVRFLLLDNMTNEQMVEVVGAIRPQEAGLGKVYLEATGGLTVERARSVALTGVDFMSVGGLTHSSPILDIGLDLF